VQTVVWRGPVRTTTTPTTSVLVTVATSRRQSASTATSRHLREAAFAAHELNWTGVHHHRFILLKTIHSQQPQTVTIHTELDSQAPSSWTGSIRKLDSSVNSRNMCVQNSSSVQFLCCERSLTFNLLWTDKSQWIWAAGCYVLTKVVIALLFVAALQFITRDFGQTPCRVRYLYFSSLCWSVRCPSVSLWWRVTSLTDRQTANAVR